MSRVPALVGFVFAASMSLAAFADGNPIVEGYLQAKGMGTVDTSKTANKIQAKLMAQRAATVDAQRNLLEMIDGVRVTSGTTVKDAELQSDIIANRVKGLLRGAFVVKQSITEDSGDYLAEVTLGVCLTGALAQCKERPTLSRIIYDTLKKPGPKQIFTAADAAATAVATSTTPTSTAASAPAAMNVAVDTSTPAPLPVPATPVTGLIVDASKLNFNPTFDARVVTGKGKLVYGAAQYNVSLGGDWLHWAKSVSAATNQTDVIGAHPLILTGVATNGDSSVVLSNKDAVRAVEANQKNGNFFGQGKVVFVIK